MGTLMNKPINVRPPVSTALPLRRRLGGPTLTPFTGPTPQTGRWQTLLIDTHSACREGEAEALIQPPRHHLFPLPALSFSLSRSLFLHEPTSASKGASH